MGHIFKPEQLLLHSKYNEDLMFDTFLRYLLSTYVPYYYSVAQVKCLKFFTPKVERLY